jgi:hypothetical protein
MDAKARQARDSTRICPLALALRTGNQTASTQVRQRQRRKTAAEATATGMGGVAHVALSGRKDSRLLVRSLRGREARIPAVSIESEAFNPMKTFRMVPNAGLPRAIESAPR